MTQSEVGAYILLLCSQWGRGEITLDPERAALVAKGPVSSHVFTKFPGGKNAKLEKVRAALNEYRALQSAKGKASAQARFNRGSTVVQPSGQPDSQPKLNSPTPTPTPTLFLTSEGEADKPPTRPVISKPEIPTAEQWESNRAAVHPNWPSMDAKAAWSFYEGNGWRTGKNPVKKWKACAQTCFLRWQKENPHHQPAARIGKDV